MDGVVDPPPLRDLLPGTLRVLLAPGWRQAGAAAAVRRAHLSPAA